MLSIFSNSGVELSGEHGGTQFPSSLGLTPAAIVLLSTLAAPARWRKDNPDSIRARPSGNSMRNNPISAQCPLAVAHRTPALDKSTADGKRCSVCATSRSPG